MLNPKGDLAAAEIAFFAPALLISLVVVTRHGFNRRLGWFYLLILSILRLIGASCTLYMEINNDYTASLYETAAITSAVGMAPLLLALMGFLKRIDMSMGQRNIPVRVFSLLHLLPIAALAIAIAGGTEIFSDDAGKVKTGRQLQEAASILFLAIYLALAGIVLHLLMHLRWVLATERKLLYAGAISLPFLLVRMIYTIASAFSNPGDIFYFGDVNVWAQALMQFLMEAIVVVVYIIAGLLTPKAPKRETAKGSQESVEDGYTSKSEHPSPLRQQQRPQKSIGDYRPGRLIMSAIRDRQEQNNV